MPSVETLPQISKEKPVTVSITPTEEAYFNSLWGRRGVARFVERREVTFRNGDRPAPCDCHGNAARWAAETPDVVPIHGWLIEADDGHHLRLVAHSLLKHVEAGWFDITPLEPYRPPFLMHEGSAETFFALLPRFNVVTWPLPGLAGGPRSGAGQ